MCAQQMEEAHAKLSSDADYRAGAATGQGVRHQQRPAGPEAGSASSVCSNRLCAALLGQGPSAPRLPEWRAWAHSARATAAPACRLPARTHAEYFTLWEQQRKVPVSAAVEDGEEDLPAPRGGRGGRGGERRAPAEPAVEPAKKAEAVIAAVLEEARDEILRVKAAAASAAAAAAPMPAVAEAAGSLAEAEPGAEGEGGRFLPGDG